jgi:hypothetical protein
VSVFNSLLWAYSVAPASVYTARLEGETDVTVSGARGSSGGADKPWRLTADVIDMVETTLKSSAVVPDDVSFTLIEQVRVMMKQRDFRAEVAKAQERVADEVCASSRWLRLIWSRLVSCDCCGWCRRSRVDLCVPRR